MIYDKIIKREKLKIGGKLSNMVRNNERELTTHLKKVIEDSYKCKVNRCPFVFLRVNKLNKANTWQIKKSLKKEGY